MGKLITYAYNICGRYVAVTVQHKPSMRSRTSKTFHSCHMYLIDQCGGVQRLRRI
ncbi:MAG: hypothetical protein RR854_05960 [Muribaculaceae bacterium]